MSLIHLQRLRRDSLIFRKLLALKLLISSPRYCRNLWVMAISLIMFIYIREDIFFTFVLLIFLKYVQLLEVDENSRLGSQGYDSVKSHPWFDGIDWKRIKDCSFPVPQEITARITQHLESHSEEYSVPPQGSPSHDEEVDIPEWFDEW